MMIKRIVLATLAMVLLSTIVTIAAAPASAAAVAEQPCAVMVSAGWSLARQVTTGGGGGKGGGGGSGGCSWQGKAVPCMTTSGYFNAADGCYYKEANPYPTSGPVYVSYKTGGGGIYWAGLLLKREVGRLRVVAAATSWAGPDAGHACAASL